MRERFQLALTYPPLFSCITPGCDVSCTTCSGPGATDCLSCPQTLILQKDRSCAGSCPQGQFHSSNNVCADCHSTCLACDTGSGANDCTACHLGWLLQKDHSCNNACPANQYPNTISKSCEDCHATCLGCAGPLSTDCVSCPSGKVLERDHSCQSSCADGGYINSSASNVCLQCMPECATCPDGSHCDTCAGTGKILTPDATSCVDSCGDGYWEAISSLQTKCEGA